jgi:hypothetical protein
MENWIVFAGIWGVCLTGVVLFLRGVSLVNARAEEAEEYRENAAMPMPAPLAAKSRATVHTAVVPQCATRTVETLTDAH